MVPHCLLSRGFRFLVGSTNLVIKTVIELQRLHSRRPFEYIAARRSLSTMKMTDQYLPKVVFVLGAPGSGKGTQCEKIVQHFGYVHLSAGELLRQERHRSGSEYADLIEKCLRDGVIVPVAITCSLLENAINHHIKQEKHPKFLIDGFPRNQDNVEGWRKQMIDKTSLQFVLFFDCNEDICTKRCINRGLEGSGRSDDNINSLRKRFQTYINATMPIINYYEEMDMVKRIDGSSTPDKVFANVKKLFGNL